MHPSSLCAVLVLGVRVMAVCAGVPVCNVPASCCVGGAAEGGEGEKKGCTFGWCSGGEEDVEGGVSSSQT